MRKYFLLAFVFLFALAFFGQVSAEDLNSNCGYLNQNKILLCNVTELPQGETFYYLNLDSLPNVVQEIQLDYYSGKNVNITQSVSKDFNFVITNKGNISNQPKLDFNITKVNPQYNLTIMGFDIDPPFLINFSVNSPFIISKLKVIDSSIAIQNLSSTLIGNVLFSSNNENSILSFIDFNVPKIGYLELIGQYILTDDNKLKTQTAVAFNYDSQDVNKTILINKFETNKGAIMSGNTLQIDIASNALNYSTIKAPKLFLNNAKLTLQNNSIFYSPLILANGVNAVLYLQDIDNRDVGIVSTSFNSTGTKTAVLDLNNINYSSDSPKFVITPISKATVGYYVSLKNSNNVDLNLIYQKEISVPEKFYFLLTVSDSSNINIFGPHFEGFEALPKDKKTLLWIEDSNDVTIDNLRYFLTDSAKKSVQRGVPISVKNTNSFVLKNSVINNSETAVNFEASDFNNIKESRLYSNSFGYNGNAVILWGKNKTWLINNFFIDNNKTVWDFESNYSFDLGGSFGKQNCDGIMDKAFGFTFPLVSIPMYYFEGSELVKKTYDPSCYGGNLFAGTTAIQGFKDAYLKDGSDGDGISETSFSFDNNTHTDYVPLVYPFVKSDFNIPLGSTEFDDYILPIKEAMSKNKGQGCDEPHFVDVGQNSTIAKLFEDKDYKYVSFDYHVSLVSLKQGQVCNGYLFNVNVQNPVFTFKLGKDPKTITKTISSEHKDINKNGTWQEPLYIPAEDTQITITDINGVKDNIMLVLSLAGKNKSASDAKTVSNWEGYSFNFKDLGLFPSFSMKVTSAPDLYQYVIDPLEVSISSQMHLDVIGVQQKYDSNTPLDFNIILTNDNPLDDKTAEYKIELLDAVGKVLSTSSESALVPAGSSKEEPHSLSLEDLETGNYSLKVTITNYNTLPVTKSFSVTAGLKLKTIKTPDNNIYFVFVLVAVVIGFYLFRKS